ncbi:hypothetical protein AB835_08020 [Candidatus Endobugula sertula]|uniref:Uncharacterized protein n=1 Tax=Candidatus Endobugula sertula TaxID=62101 RepID=A0A1D2QPN4_9GAMM|nr:hypothetical protein AB835_08020 [Candidatus Endobugula sertula]
MSFDSFNNENQQLVTLKRQLAVMEKELKDRGNEDNLDHEPEYAVLFTGNWQSSIPNQLILNPDLSPVEKITWQVWRLAIPHPGKPGATPRSSELMRHANCSKPTLTSAKAMLRVTRWATRCRSVRNSHGRFLGDIYLLHDQPLSLAANLELDPEYLSYLDSLVMSEKKNKRLRAVAASIIRSVREDELTPQQRTELQSCVANLGMFLESESGFPIYREADQNTTQVKNFNPVESGNTPLEVEESVEIPSTSIQDKKFNLDDTSKNDQKTTQDKNFNPVEPDKNTRLKNFLTASSSSSNNKINNNISYARAREEESHLLADQDISEFITSNVPLIGNVLANLFKQVFIARESAVPVLMTKIKPLSRRQQVNVLCQLLGRLIQADKNEANEVRDVVRYCHSLVTAEKENRLMLDEYAQRIKEAVEDDMPLVI